MADEDFTTYTEVDIAQNRIQVDSATQCRMVGVDLDETVYLYKDYGVAGIAGPRVITFHLITGAYNDNARGFLWGFGSNLGDWANAAGPAIAFRIRHNNSGNNWQFSIAEKDALGNNYRDTYDYPNNNSGVNLYPEITWSGNSLVAKIYSNAARTSLLDTVSLTLQSSSYTFQYAYALQSDNVSLGGRALLYTHKNLDLGALSTGSAELKAVFEIPAPSADLKALFTVRQPDSVDLKAVFEVGQGAIDVFAEAVVRHSETADVFAQFTVCCLGARDLYAEFTVRHSASEELKAIFTIPQGAADLLAYFVVHIPELTAELPATFSVAHHGALALPAKFWVRHPYWLWTNRRYLDGVIELDNIELSDALLEYTIEGVMVDIQGFLVTEELSYDWVDITEVPKLIKRATTYGVAASLFARGFFDNRIAVSIPPRTLTVLPEDRNSGMEYWESRMETMLERYSSSIPGVVLYVDTHDEEPVFTMDDIPTYSEDVYKEPVL